MWKKGIAVLFIVFLCGESAHSQTYTVPMSDLEHILSLEDVIVTDLPRAMNHLIRKRLKKMVDDSEVRVYLDRLESVSYIDYSKISVVGVETISNVFCRSGNGIAIYFGSDGTPDGKTFMIVHSPSDKSLILLKFDLKNTDLKQISDET